MTGGYPAYSPERRDRPAGTARHSCAPRPDRDPHIGQPITAQTQTGANKNSLLHTGIK